MRKGWQKLTPGSLLDVPVLTRQASICLVVSVPRREQGISLCGDGHGQEATSALERAEFGLKNLSR